MHHQGQGYPLRQKGMTVMGFNGDASASLFLPFCFYHDDYMHPSGGVENASGDSTAMIEVLRISADAIEQLESLDDETLSSGPRSKWMQKQRQKGELMSAKSKYSNMHQKCRTVIGDYHFL